MKYLLLFLLFLSTSLFANIGKITALKGDASIIRDAQTLIPKTGFIIEKNDKINTSANARIQVVFKDNTIISLGKNTSFSINDYFYDEQQPQKTNASFGMAKGIFKTITGRIGKINPNKFKLKTKSAAIGIRGTTFFGEDNGGKGSYSCTQGKISVTTDLGTVEVNAGEMTQVEIGKPPSPPVKLSAEQKTTLEKDSGAKENEEESGQTAATAEEKPKEEEKKEEKKQAKKEDKKEDTTDEGSDDGQKEEKKEDTATAEPTNDEPTDPEGGGTDVAGGEADTQVEADIDLGEPEVEIIAPEVDDIVTDIDVDDVVDDANDAKDDVVVSENTATATTTIYEGFATYGNTFSDMYAVTTGNNYTGYIGHEGGVYDSHGSEGYPATYIPFTGSLDNTQSSTMNGTIPNYNYTTDSYDLVNVNGVLTPVAFISAQETGWGTTFVDSDNDSYADQYGVFILADVSTRIDDLSSWITTNAPTSANYYGPIAGYINGTTFIDPEYSYITMNIYFSTNQLNATLYVNGTANWAAISGYTLGAEGDAYYASLGTGSSGMGYIRGSLHNDAASSIGYFSMTSGSDTASGVYNTAKVTDSSSKTATYYSMHTATNTLVNSAGSDIIGISADNNYKIRDGFDASYSITNGVITGDDQLTKYKYDSGSYIIDTGSTPNPKDYDMSSDISSKNLYSIYTGFRFVWDSTYDHDNDSGTDEIRNAALFMDAKKEFAVKMIRENSYYDYNGEKIYTADSAYKTFCLFLDNF
jgi:hypothetical protein